MLRRYSLLGLGALLASSACERAHVLLWSLDGGDSGSDAGGSDGAQADATPPYVVDGSVVFCGNAPCACSNGQDDDRDGLTDGFDPECTGGFDQDEATFATGEIKDGNRRCSDCFFDANGGYEDDCKIATSCTTDGNASGGTGACNTCTASEQCIRNCKPLTPNGCDCFGCCQIESGTQSLTILLADTCTMAVLANESKCPRCYLTVDTENGCFNKCGRCELCPGRTADELPSDCNDGELGYDCEDATVCGGPNALCDDRAWCLQGCCTPLLY